MFQAITNRSVRMVERYLPDPFIFVLVLTLLVFALGMVSSGKALSLWWNSGAGASGTC